jgi:23S rRNA (adenine2503-C2)-methyltransferase
MKLLETVKSRHDSTVKYIFESQGQILEFSYIDNGTGKDIVCVPTQTGCSLGCQFCYLSDVDLKVRNLDVNEITEPVDEITRSLPDRKKTLLVSYMGCGEPMLNMDSVYRSMIAIRKTWAQVYETVRFGMATLLPKNCWTALNTLADTVKDAGLKLKVHLSLHSPYDDVRHFLMPAAANVQDAVKALRNYREVTGNSVEIHYALMYKVNDRNIDAVGMVGLLKKDKIPVKFLVYNEKPTATSWLRRSACVAGFRATLGANGIPTEFYEPPGSDIGASCGQFLLDYYIKYNKAHEL